MAYLVGLVLAIGVCLFATAVGFDRDRAFYPTLLIVIASYWGLFAVMGGGPGVLVRECSVLVAFLLLAAAGFKWSPWLLVIGLGAHGVFDLGHARLFENPGAPAWWPAFCLTYDVATAAYLAWRLQRAGSAGAAV
jgi:hypothetical protein